LYASLSSLSFLLSFSPYSAFSVSRNTNVTWNWIDVMCDTKIMETIGKIDKKGCCEERKPTIYTYLAVLVFFGVQPSAAYIQAMREDFKVKMLIIWKIIICHSTHMWNHPWDDMGRLICNNSRNIINERQKIFLVSVWVVLEASIHWVFEFFPESSSWMKFVLAQPAAIFLKGHSKGHVN
jgi:hypothetical protein